MTVYGGTTPARPERPLAPAMRRGMASRCPSCGEGRLFHRFLKVTPTCENCGEELHHHRADDAPAYLTMVIIGHIVVFAMLHMEMAGGEHGLFYLLGLLPLSVVGSLLLIQPIKGAIVALQWSRYMHGFDPDADDDSDLGTNGAAPRT